MPEGAREDSGLNWEQSLHKTREGRDTKLAQSLKHTTLDLRVMSSSPRLGVELTLKKKKKLNKIRHSMEQRKRPVFRIRVKSELGLGRVWDSLWIF